ncbi:MAG: SLC13 family permease [Candidatus Odinarchaeota archaeon]
MANEILVMLVFAGIFVITYALIALSEEKKLITILCGAVLAIFAGLFLLQTEHGQFTFERIFEPDYIEWEVIVIVMGMSLLVEALNKTHVFDYISIKVIKLSKGQPVFLMFVVFYLTFFLSAILDNVTAIILVSSITMTVCKGLDLNPVPFFYSAIFATVTAGLATIVGSLPSILIGTAAGFSFMGFFLVGFPLAFILSVIQVFYFRFAFKKQLEEDSRKLVSIATIEYLDPWAIVENKHNFYSSMGILGLVIIGFVGSGEDGFIKQLFGVEVSIGLVALACAVLLIAITRADIEQLIKRVHWDTVLFFICLFVLVGTLKDSGVLTTLATELVAISAGNILLMLVIIMVAAASLSALVDNIPVSAAFREVIKDILIDIGAVRSTADATWWILLSGVTFGGGFTPIGTAPAVVATGILKEDGRSTSFLGFFKLMGPISAICLIVSFFYIIGVSFILMGS